MTHCLLPLQIFQFIDKRDYIEENTVYSSR